MTEQAFRCAKACSYICCGQPKLQLTTIQDLRRHGRLYLRSESSKMAWASCCFAKRIPYRMGKEGVVQEALQTG